MFKSFFRYDSITKCTICAKKSYGGPNCQTKCQRKLGFPLALKNDLKLKEFKCQYCHDKFLSLKAKLNHLACCPQLLQIIFDVRKTCLTLLLNHFYPSLISGLGKR